MPRKDGLFVVIITFALIWIDTPSRPTWLLSPEIATVSLRLDLSHFGVERLGPFPNLRFVRNGCTTRSINRPRIHIVNELLHGPWVRSFRLLGHLKPGPVHQARHSCA
jgi:hypothetical protein